MKAGDGTPGSASPTTSFYAQTEIGAKAKTREGVAALPYNGIVRSGEVGAKAGDGTPGSVTPTTSFYAQTEIGVKSRNNKAGNRVACLIS